MKWHATIHTLAQNIIVTSLAQNYSWLRLRNIKSRPEYSRSKQSHFMAITLHETILRVNFRNHHIVHESFRTGH